jgi:hypothetical protein
MSTANTNESAAEVAARDPAVSSASTPAVFDVTTVTDSRVGDLTARPTESTRVVSDRRANEAATDIKKKALEAEALRLRVIAEERAFRVRAAAYAAGLNSSVLTQDNQSLEDLLVPAPRGDTSVRTGASPGPRDVLLEDVSFYSFLEKNTKNINNDPRMARYIAEQRQQYVLNTSLDTFRTQQVQTREPPRQRRDLGNYSISAMINSGIGDGVGAGGKDSAYVARIPTQAPSRFGQSIGMTAFQSIRKKTTSTFRDLFSLKSESKKPKEKTRADHGNPAPAPSQASTPGRRPARQSTMAQRTNEPAHAFNAATYQAAPGIMPDAAGRQLEEEHLDTRPAVNIVPLNSTRLDLPSQEDRSTHLEHVPLSSANPDTVQEGVGPPAFDSSPPVLGAEGGIEQETHLEASPIRAARFTEDLAFQIGSAIVAVASGERPRSRNEQGAMDLLTAANPDFQDLAKKIIGELPKIMGNCKEMIREARDLNRVCDSNLRKAVKLHTDTMDESKAMRCTFELLANDQHGLEQAQGEQAKEIECLHSDQERNKAIQEILKTDQDNFQELLEADVDNMITVKGRVDQIITTVGALSPQHLQRMLDALRQEMALESEKQKEDMILSGQVPLEAFVKGWITENVPTILADTMPGFMVEEMESKDGYWSADNYVKRRQLLRDTGYQTADQAEKYSKGKAQSAEQAEKSLKLGQTRTNAVVKPEPIKVKKELNERLAQLSKKIGSATDPSPGIRTHCVSSVNRLTPGEYSSESGTDDTEKARARIAYRAGKRKPPVVISKPSTDIEKQVVEKAIRSKSRPKSKALEESLEPETVDNHPDSDSDSALFVPDKKKKHKKPGVNPDEWIELTGYMYQLLQMDKITVVNGMVKRSGCYLMDNSILGDRDMDEVMALFYLHPELYKVENLTPPIKEVPEFPTPLSPRTLRRGGGDREFPFPERTQPMGAIPDNVFNRAQSPLQSRYEEGAFVQTPEAKGKPKIPSQVVFSGEGDLEKFIRTVDIYCNARPWPTQVKDIALLEQLTTGVGDVVMNNSYYIAGDYENTKKVLRNLYRNDINCRREAQLFANARRNEGEPHAVLVSRLNSLHRSWEPNSPEAQRDRQVKQKWLEIIPPEHSLRVTNLEASAEICAKELDKIIHWFIPQVPPTAGAEAGLRPVNNANADSYNEAPVLAFHQEKGDSRGPDGGSRGARGGPRGGANKGRRNRNGKDKQDNKGGTVRAGSFPECEFCGLKNHLNKDCWREQIRVKVMAQLKGEYEKKHSTLEKKLAKDWDDKFKALEARVTTPLSAANVAVAGEELAPGNELRHP